MTDLVYIVDDDAPFRASIARLLKLHGYDVVEYGSADEFLEHAGRGASPGCVLLDIQLPGLSGPNLQERLAEIDFSLPIIFLTGHADVPTTVRAMKAGAEDFLTKPASKQQLIASIKGALGRLGANHAKEEWKKSARSRLDSLTPREREVFEYVARGKLNKHTAHELGITERTIKAHRQRIFEKLEAKTVADLVSFAERLSILR